MKADKVVKILLMMKWYQPTTQINTWGVSGEQDLVIVQLIQLLLFHPTLQTVVVAVEEVVKVLNSQWYTTLQQ